MRTTALFVTVMGTALLVAAASPQDVKEESANRIKELKKERIAALKSVAELMTNLYQRGSGTIDDVFEAKLQALNAEADAAETAQDRIKFYENIVDLSKQYEELAIASREAARGTHATVLKMKARRLEAEITLEQAKAAKR